MISRFRRSSAVPSIPRAGRAPRLPFPPRGESSSDLEETAMPRPEHTPAAPFSASPAPESTDALSAGGIERYLTNSQVTVRYEPVITSTNTVLKQMALDGAPAGLALVAGQQTAGRGRMGRSFYSPAATGLYLSLLLRPDLPLSQAAGLTACAAVSVAESIESLADLHPRIKWVNDLYLGSRKVCGILTEAVPAPGQDRMSQVIVGIGVNTRVPADDFPPELREIAGAVFGTAAIPDLRCRLAAGILDRLMQYAAHPADPRIWQKYRERSFVLGRPVQILAPGQAPVQATALDLESDYALRVRLSDGTEQLLRSGEISLRL